MLNRRQVLASAPLLALAHATAAPPPFPTKPIRLVYNFAPGGPGDAVSRYLAQQMAPLLGQPVFVENLTGGAGAVGILNAARAPADGHTILYTPVSGVVQVPLVTKDGKFDPFKSLSPLAGVGVTPLAIVAHPSVPADDVPSFLAWARTQASGVDVAGAGPITEVACALLANEAKLKLVYVGYRGASQALQAVLAGEVKVYFIVPSAATAEFLKAGKLKALGVTTAQPSPLLPGVGTIGKHVPGYVQEITFALWAPAGVPAEAATRLVDALKKVLDEPETVERFSANGLSLHFRPAHELEQVTRREAENIRRILETTPVKFGG
ncbi:tripartite tricarboxylate transporter substrate binding protein [Variovorax sp. WS11]|uniref:Bug family tripartite tricarboxylate transporter substrate binding protein n=1 Tax=Variovorax sp. WS11 TaxID=1105204 RepID=UPI000D0CF490|nr:tripartite tricarboxylate transporter substrate binding protein [Variovorax sp. WS11]NDZ18555.1 tripartite tricarboxylate transporter substrate binding protein [Variovorax sp. WS11]PSL85186.1 tripartite tricarboxylate transporter substrate binding protein [Variovorax sp. WS11]